MDYNTISHPTHDSDSSGGSSGDSTSVDSRSSEEDSSDELTISSKLFSYSYSAGLKPHIIQEIYNHSQFNGHVALYLLKVPDYSNRSV